MSPHFNVKPELAVAIAKVESSLNPNAVGAIGEIGLFQIRPKYSKFTSSELFNIPTNIIEGLRMLRFAKKHCKHKIDYTWVTCYNAGLTGGSRIENPKEFDYYKKVMKRLSEDKDVQNGIIRKKEQTNETTTYTTAS